MVKKIQYNRSLNHVPKSVIVIDARIGKLTPNGKNANAKQSQSDECTGEEDEPDNQLKRE